MPRREIYHEDAKAERVNHEDTKTRRREKVGGSASVHDFVSGQAVTQQATSFSLLFFVPSCLRGEKSCLRGEDWSARCC